MNIFILAQKQLEREGQAHRQGLLIDRVIRIRKYLDLSDRNSKVAKNRVK